MSFIWSNIFKEKDESRDTNLDVLKKVPIFSGLKNLELKEFLRILHIRTYAPQETIFWEGEPGVGMYIIQMGRVQISKLRGEDKSATVLAELSEGDFFGELALLDDSPRSACAIAIEDTQVVGIFRPDLMELFDRKPKLGVKVLFLLANMIGVRLKATNQELKRLQEQLAVGKIS